MAVMKMQHALMRMARTLAFARMDSQEMDPIVQVRGWVKLNFPYVNRLSRV